MASNPRLIDLTGKQFGRWKVIEKAGNSKRGGALWRCVCACGTERVCQGADLRSQKSRSCGCLMIEETRQRSTIHGGKATPLYCVWKTMRSRCNNPKSTSFKYYGAKGIGVCAEWNDFAKFKAWAEESGYRKGLSIERKNNSLGYSPKNCVWATRTEQSANRSIVLLSSSGEPWCNIAKRHGIPVTLMHGRIHEGWPIEKAATLPKGSRLK
jgi:hypothetical protein